MVRAARRRARQGRVGRPEERGGDRGYARVDPPTRPHTQAAGARTDHAKKDPRNRCRDRGSHPGAVRMSTRLFRWVGSKHHLVPRLAPLLREQLVFGGGRIVSLFYGSGALEQAAALTEPQLAAEANPELRCLYEQLVHRPSQVHAALISLDASVSRNRAAFLRVRALDAEALSPPDRALRFLWLSAMSFNGLVRVNCHGPHNVPPDTSGL